jgi:hypothetical protein
MRIADHLSKEQKQQLSKVTPKNKRKVKVQSKPKKKENLSFRDIEELMGTRRDTYERRNGAMRRR